MTTTTATQHKITWWAYTGAPRSHPEWRIRRTAKMRGTWSYDVTCSCGWETKTGGATKRWITDEIWFHKRGC